MIAPPTSNVHRFLGAGLNQWQAWEDEQVLLLREATDQSVELEEAWEQNLHGAITSTHCRIIKLSETRRLEHVVMVTIPRSAMTRLCSRMPWR